MKLLFLAPYPEDESPSQRYRFEHYLPFLRKNNIVINYQPFLGRKAWDIIFKEGRTLQKAFSIVAGFFRRWLLMFTIRQYDFIYIHREAAPIGPPIFEWIIARIYRKKIIYDFDDAIWVPVTSANNKMARHIKWFSKVARICSMSYKVSAGNEYLADFARQYCKNVIVVPTVVDTESEHNTIQNQSVEHPVVGWTGTFSTLKYLDIVVPAMQKLQERHNFTFVVIANKDPMLSLKNYRFILWRKETEITDLLSMHIGIMPLFDGEIEKGKCGFKAIQYMALGIPSVVSPVGVNKDIVKNNQTGYIAISEKEWEEKIEMLLKDESLRKRFGKESRKVIEDHYSVKSTTELFKQLFS